MYRQDKTTTERHTRILRELVKQPGNKECADCKRNDARWASWNIGVFVCIRCSGIHRSMGTHISKVKSIDLDTWTPEQMDSIQRWGNHRANLYWEAHLRAGHRPPEHKMESFIRSKYESRRWAREGPPPADPAVLEAGVETTNHTTEVPTSTPLVSQRPASPAASTPLTTRQPQPHRLLSASTAGRAPIAQPVQVAASTSETPGQPSESKQPDDIFSLDFHAPSPSAVQQQQQLSQTPKKDVKHDILSLFSTSAAAPAVPLSGVGPAQFGAQQSVAPDPYAQWDQSRVHPQQQQKPPQVTSMAGSSGTAMWGAQSGWMAPPPPTQSNVWGDFQNASSSTPAVVATPAQPISQGIFETQSIWGSTVSNTQANGGMSDPFGSFSGASAGTPVSLTQKKNDAFGDLWGDFK